jgi:hypothetical protein
MRGFVKFYEEEEEGEVFRCQQVRQKWNPESADFRGLHGFFIRKSLLNL